MKKLASAFLISTFATVAFAQQGVTVDTLLKEGYEVKGVFPSNAGPGLVLQKGDELVMCFVAETPQSDAVNTQYCKPVH